MMLERLFKIWPQYLLPQHRLSRLMYRFMRIRTGWIKDLQIASIVRLYGVNMREAEVPGADGYTSFNAFFTRRLRPDARPLGDAAIVCPADGTISELGRVEAGRLLQAKGRRYALQALLAGDEQAAADFLDGSFMTIYLSPRDYHRVHMPLAGTLRSMVYVPGRLFSVNRVTTREVPDLFARNERLICAFDTELGPMTLVLVGAIFVGSMETVWAGQVTPPYGRAPRTLRYPADGDDATHLSQGQEMGRFNMGSTVIMLLPPGAPAWQADLSTGRGVRMGQSLTPT